MSTISFCKRTILFALTVTGPLIFSQCNEGENYKESEDANKAQESTYDEKSAMYPDEKLQKNTNLTDDQPLELQEDGFHSLDKNILFATLNKQKTELQYQLEQMENGPSNAADLAVVQATPQQLKASVLKLDDEMAKVRNATASNFKEVANSAQAAIKEAGKLMAHNKAEVQRGF